MEDLIREKWDDILKAMKEEYEIQNISFNTWILPLKLYARANVSGSAEAVNMGLKPNYTFETFVVGNNNNLAHAAALAVAETPGHVYNPLFIYGGAGLGKTHLMQAIAHFIMQNNPDLKVLYVTSETFTNELIESLKNQKMTNQEFRNKYRNIDVTYCRHPDSYI